MGLWRRKNYEVREEKFCPFTYSYCMRGVIYQPHEGFFSKFGEKRGSCSSVTAYSYPLTAYRTSGYAAVGILKTLHLKRPN